jgi:hypothetical protein
MKKPPQIMTKEQFDTQRRDNITRQAGEFKRGRKEFDMNFKNRQRHSDSANSQRQALSGIDAKYSQLLDVFDMKIAAARENRQLLLQQASSLMDTELIDDLNRSVSQCEHDIDELYGQKATISDQIKNLDNSLDDLLVRYGSGAGNMGKNSSSQSRIAAVGSPSNTYDPTVPGAEDAAFERALWGSAAAKLGVDVSVMKEL